MKKKYKIGIIVFVLIIIVSAIHQTKNEKIEVCFDKPTDVGVKACLMFVMQENSPITAIRSLGNIN